MPPNGNEGKLLIFTLISSNWQPHKIKPESTYWSQCIVTTLLYIIYIEYLASHAKRLVNAYIVK